MNGRGLRRRRRLGKKKYNIKGVILGNSQYGEGVSNLKGVENAVHFLKKQLGENVQLWLNETYGTAVSKLTKFLEETTLSKQDIFLFYFCGHGHYTGAACEKLLLACSDTSEKNYTAIGIPFEWLLNEVKQRLGSQYIIVLDCCHSGLASAMGLAEFNLDQYELDDGTHGAIFTSTSSVIEYAKEIQIHAKSYAAFTYFFAETLQNGIDGKGEYLQLQDIYNAIYEKVKNYNKSASALLLPSPQIKCVGKIDQIGIFRNADTRKLQKILMDADISCKYNLKHHSIKKYEVGGGFADLKEIREMREYYRKKYSPGGGFRDILDEMDNKRGSKR